MVAVLLHPLQVNLHYKYLAEESDEDEFNDSQEDGGDSYENEISEPSDVEIEDITDSI